MSLPQKRKADETEEPQTEKRGRGRPRKYPKTETPTVTPQQTVNDQTPGSKRGRGRPRKHPKVERTNKVKLGLDSLGQRKHPFIFLKIKTLSSPLKSNTG